MKKYGNYVKIIHGRSVDEVEDKVNSWLKVQGIVILKILQSESSEGLTFSIFYEEKELV